MPSFSHCKGEGDGRKEQQGPGSGGLNEGCEWFAVGTGDPLKVSPPGNEVIRDVLQEEVSQRGVKSTAEGGWEAAALAPPLRAGPFLEASPDPFLHSEHGCGAGDQRA